MSERRAWPVDVRPEERFVFGALFLHAALNGTALVFFETTASALFLTQVGADRLPFVYLGTALISAVLGVVLVKLERRVRRVRLLQGLLWLAFLSVALLGLAAVLAPGAVTSVALMVWKDVLWIMLGMEFWGLAGSLLDLRQGKRLFGAINGGAVLAMVVGGASVPVLTPFLGTGGLLALTAASLLGSVIIAGRLPEAEDQDDDASEIEGSRRARAKAYGTRYFRLFVAMSVLSVLAAYTLDYVFLGEVQEAIPEAGDIASFFGAFFAGYGLLQIVMSIGLVGKILTRVGVGGALVVLPLADALGSVGMVGLGLAGAAALVLGIAVATKLADEVVRQTLEVPASRILYQAFPGTVRFRIQTLVELGIEPLAMGLSGLLLLASASVLGLGTTGIAILLAVVTLAWLWVVRALAEEYPKALSHALASHRLSPSPLPWGDPSTLEVVGRALESPLPGEVIYGLGALERLDEDALPPALEKALAHDAPQVRRYALDRIENLELRELTDALLRTAESDEDPSVLGAAGRCLAVLHGTEPVRVMELLRDVNDSVRRETMVGLLRNGSPDALEATEPLVYEMSAHPDPDRRAVVAQALGRGRGGFPSVLADLLDDEHGEVRAAAAEAAGTVGDPGFLPGLVEALADPEVRESAASGLARHGEGAAPVVAGMLRREDVPQGARRRAARILGRLGPAGFEELRNALDHPEEEVRLEVIRALADGGFQAGPEERTAVQEQIDAELEDAHWTLETARILRGGEKDEVLESALAHEVDKNLRRIVLLLALVLDRESVLEAATVLFGKAPGLTAQAAELLETLVPRDLASELLPLVEERGRVSRPLPAGPPERRRRLNALVGRSGHLTSAWARVAALHAMGRDPHPDHVDAVESALGSSEAIVRETALWVLVELNVGNALIALERAEHDPALSVRRISRALREDRARGRDAPRRKIMLLTIERVMVLKSVEVFADIPEEYLAELAASVHEVEMVAGDEVIRKGDAGSHMYVIVRGRMRVHDGDRTIAELGPREVFGELAALDPEVRSASVSALEDGLLYRISQRMLYHLMAERTEVARGVIGVLCRRLRNAIAS